MDKIVISAASHKLKKRNRYGASVKLHGLTALPYNLAMFHAKTLYDANQPSKDVQSWFLSIDEAKRLQRVLTEVLDAVEKGALDER